MIKYLKSDVLTVRQYYQSLNISLIRLKCSLQFQFAQSENLHQMGSNKHKRNKKKSENHNNSQNTQHFVQKPTDSQLTSLTDEALQISKLLNEKQQKIKQSKDFVYLLSTKWLNEWKDYVGYNSLMNEHNETKNKMGKIKPKAPNVNLPDSASNLLQIPQQLQQEYSFLNVVLNNKLSKDEDYIGIPKQLWQKFNNIYGPGIEIKRPFRITKQKSIYIDSSLLKCDFIFVNYNEPDFDSKIEHYKSTKTNSFIFDHKIQFSAIWNLENLYSFIQKICVVKYFCNQVTLWLCENFIGTQKIKESFSKTAKNKTYQIYGFKLQRTDYKNLDLDDFLKSHYTLLVEIGKSRITSQQNPDEPNGYCEQCLKVNQQLRYHCECGHRYYCCKQCQSDDQVFHFKSCPQAFCSSNDDIYKKKKSFQVSKVSKCGLKNLGNTCYMNSSIQFLFSLDFLTNFFTSNDYRNQISKKEQYAEMFLDKISKTFKQMGEQTKMSSIQPWELKGQINYFLSAFQGYKQHDANEFLTNLITSINDCLASPSQQQAYHPIIKNNLLGQFASLVICPDCKVKVKNIQIFTQLSLPIKHKIQKHLYHYVCFDNPFTYKFGKAQVRNTWAAIKSDIGVSSDCLMFLGNEVDNYLLMVTEDQPSETLLKKTKKQLLFYPNLKINKDQIILPANFITTKIVSGQNMKANTSYSFPVVAKFGKTMGHFVIDLIRQICVNRNQDILKQIQLKYDDICKKRQQQKKQSTADQQTSSQLKQQKSEKSEQQESKDNTIKVASKSQQIEKSLELLDNQIKNILSELQIQIFIEDTKKKKNICHFCSKRCQGCQLTSSFKTKVQDLLANKYKQTKILINFSYKLEFIKQIQDKASNNDITINDCFLLFGQPQILDQENAWYCYNCQNMKLALKQLQVLKFPKYLIIQIIRFKNGPNGKAKNNQPITYQEYEIIGNQKYRLLSVILHEGSLENGHYWAICRRGESFFIFNDDKISKTDKVINKNAYILCYQLLNIQQLNQNYKTSDIC